ncbi:MAG TPA: 16S rRNA (guanine(527)-N(7))-methyltransferase RsmG [Solirubrobacteraceae bacterium]|jgi:16S rRNA (guanine527-N7)-methyltransferase|nr:16S rRNA (guanine(527)-N(7))-methyltransferase RsmG [Solirubrobacteraceae bacterium]
METDDGLPAALSLLATKWGLRAHQREQLAALLEQLVLDGRAPTSVREPAVAVDTHLADSLVALDIAPVRDAATIADLGSGAGFPGLPLAIARADCEVRLLESQGRKCAYLEDAIARAGIRNARVVCARAEDWQEGLGANDVVTARAVGPQPMVLEYAAPLLRLEGMLVDWRGRRSAGEERDALRAAEELGLAPVGIERVRPFAGARDRHLHLYVKVRETPARFPRRAGIARKRPLGG